MCTVTFIPKPNNGFVLTSNRDEAPGRATIFPKTYIEDDVKLLYPKDALAGGTWIGVSQMKRLVTLMNGGFVAHKRNPPYRKSRGVVVTDLLKAKNLHAAVEAYNFKGIEPFTAIIVAWNKTIQLFQLVWDGETPHFSEEPLAPKIWSSSPLYPAQLKEKREQWFSQFLFEKVRPTQEELFHFHKTAGEGDSTSNLVMDRGMVKTKSITQVVKNNETIKMHYKDLQTEKKEESVFRVQ
ncbi:NRDE family protein [Aequorivita marina]|uniref:NRDE family protein n=1 Tax=Aequorivita marina TaxID=3073654 RepID=UPI0028766842|nr:NRDE family protein [Aequorivita sp. S2608]MDS1298260.1 NRDE family protein [Aequorivita sp. S2608]